jgi:membrane protease YdiL (CAAX protease family)
MPKTGNGLAPSLLVLAVILVPVFVPIRVPFFYEDSVYRELAYEYAFKLITLVLVLVIPTLRRCVRASFPRLRGNYESRLMVILRVAMLVCIAVLVQYVLNYTVVKPLVGLISDSQPEAPLKIQSLPVAWLDLTFGLALVALAEEFGFRIVLRNIVEHYTRNVFVVVVFSSFVFSIAHWNNGFEMVVGTFFLGFILMGLYLRTGSILPSILVHYLLNFLIYFPWYFS